MTFRRLLIGLHFRFCVRSFGAVVMRARRLLLGARLGSTGIFRTAGFAGRSFLLRAARFSFFLVASLGRFTGQNSQGNETRQSEQCKNLFHRNEFWCTKSSQKLSQGQEPYSPNMLNICALNQKQRCFSAQKQGYAEFRFNKPKALRLLT